MDTLVIVRKIREAENLADGGNHAEAVRLLEPLLKQDALSGAHRELIRKKIELIERQRQRATRIMARAKDADEPTVIALAEPDRTERPTETAIEKVAEGEPTEAVPRFDDREKTRKRPMRKSDPAMPVSPDENATLRVPPPPGLLDASDTQQVPRPAEMPAPRVFDHIVDTSEHKLLPLEDEPEIEDETPVPTPADLTSGEHRKLAEVGIVPTPVPGPPAVRKGKTEKVDEDQHFGHKPTTRKNVKSTPDLKALAENLPAEDMRRDLALEVVRLREELERSRRKPPTGPAPTRRSEKPESGKFLIPASQANTIVRRAAGSESIEVHMPSRDENMPELQVLRRDSFKGKRPDDAASPSESAARAYVEKSSNRGRAVKLRPVLTVLVAVFILGSLVALAWLGWNALAGKAASGGDATMTENAVGGLALGADTAGLEEGPGGMLKTPEGWLVQHADGKVIAITVRLDREESGVSEVHFGNRSLRLSEGTGASQVEKAMGEPFTAPDKEALKSGTQSLKFRHNLGDGVLEFIYRKDDTRAIAIRLYSERANAPLPVIDE